MIRGIIPTSIEFMKQKHKDVISHTFLYYLDLTVVGGTR
jgi:hypothetical protein